MGHSQEGGSTDGGVRRRTTTPGCGAAGSGSVRPDKVKWHWVSPKNEMANNMFSNDSRLVSPKGSVLPQRCETKRSVAVQTVDSIEYENSLWCRVTTSTTVTVATQTFAPEALQQCCCIQHKSWMELQRLQRRIQRTATQAGENEKNAQTRLIFCRCARTHLCAKVARLTTSLKENRTFDTQTNQ